VPAPSETVAAAGLRPAASVRAGGRWDG
jgi:hypothetical protein